MITQFDLFLENNNENNEYFVYCFVDTRKPGKYIFKDVIDYEFNYEPIYIGKGKGIRPHRHFTLYKTSHTRFYNKLRSIIEEGFQPEIIYLENNLSEVDAFLQEIYFIKLIGRVENGGTLTNLSDGGDGQSGFKFSSESKEKMSASRSGEKNPNYGKHISEETKLKISLSRTGQKSGFKGKHHTEEAKMIMSTKGKLRIGEKNGMFGKKHRPESIEKMKQNHPKLMGKDNPSFGRERKEEEKIFDTWELTNIDGTVLIIDNLTKFCRENNLTISCMADLFKGKRKSNYKGWIKIKKLTNNVK